MRNKFIIFITAGIVSLTSFATSASAQDSVNSEVAGPNRVFGGLEWYNSHKNNSSQNLTYNQSIWSGMLGYEYSERENVYFQGRGLWGGGKGDTTKSSINYNMFSHAWFLEGRMGYQFALGEYQEYGVTPYIGYMYRSKKTAVKSNSVLKGYYANPRMQSIDLGVLFDWMIMPQVSIGLNVEALFNVKGRVTTDATTVAGVEFTKKTVNLKNKVDWLFELPFTYQIDKEWDISLVPFYNWNEYQVKNNSSYVVKTTNSGIRLESGFRF
jgi:hypothetical protein